MNIEDAEKEFSVAKLGDEPPKTVFLSDAEKNSTGNVVLSDDFFQYDRGAIKSFESGIVNGIEDLSNYGNRLEVWGGQGLMKVGDILGNEKITTVGKEMIQVAQHNIDKVSSSMKYASPKELESFANNLGGGAVNYGLIFLTGGLAGAGAKAVGASATAAAGIGEASVFAEMFGMSAGQEAQQRIDVYKKRTGDVELKGYTPEMAGKNFAASTLYGVGEGILEKWAFKEQRILFKNPLTMLKTGSIAGLKEGGTEALQSLLDIGIDLADGTITYQELPEAVRGLCMEAAVGATLGFTAGVSVGAAQRSNAIKEMERSISNTIPDPKERNLVAKEVVDNVINTMQGVIATEAKYSSEFKDAYGDTYNAMQQAAFQAMKDSGGYEGMTEDELAQLSSENAKMFASQVAAEANKRNSLIQDVIKSSDIVYDKETKELRLGKKGEKSLGVKYSQEENSKLKKWFGQSVVVGDNKEPLVVWHGSPEENGNFNVFDYERIRHSASGPGFNFSEKNEGIYGSARPFYIRITNPASLEQVTITREQLENTIKEFNKAGSENLFFLEGYGNPYNEYEKTLKSAVDTIMQYAESDAEILDSLRSNAEGNVRSVFESFVRNTGKDGFINKERGIYVVLGSNQIKSTESKEFSLSEEDVYKQKTKKNKSKGTFDAKSKVIQLFEKADASTLDHELAHFWLDNMWTYANSGAASEQYIAQFNAVKDYLGVRPDQRYLTRSQHEKFASAYEKYIYRGEIPNSIMGNVFDNYERFIRNVYNSIQDIKAEGRKKVRLTPEIIKFFDSMIKGGIDTTAATETIASEVRNEEAQKADDVTMKESKEVISEMPEREVQPEIKPIETEGKAKESRLYERMKGIVGDEGKLEYNVVEIKEQREKARKLWNENPDKARAILKGTEQADDILRQALYTEQQRLALQNGDTNTFLTSLRKQSAEATRMGQELSALRGVVEDITDPAYWIRSAETEALKNLAKKQTKNLENAMGNSPLMELTARLDADIKALQKDVASKATDEEKTKAFKEGVKAIAEKYKGLEQPDLVLNQVDWSNEELADDYIETKVKEKLGIALPKDTAKAFIQTARELDTLSRQRDEMGNPVDAFFAKKDELERMRNSHTPTSRTKVLISTIGRANMLTAPSTSVLNVVSNSLNYGAENVVRKVGNILEGKTNDNIVSKDLKDKYRAKAWRVFWGTGYDMSFMTSLLDERLYKGESVSHSEGDGAIRALGRWTEKYIFSRLISSPDIYFKSILGFTNYVGNEATDIAYKEGLTGEQAKARADELFKDAIKIEPETELGQQIRAKAQTDALILTFQQDTRFARMLLDVRNAINKGTGDIGIGDILSPFIKTPANIISMGFDAAVGPFASPVNLIGALNDIKAKNYRSARVLQAAKQTTTAALAYTVIALLASMLIDDDDYIPDYAQLTQKERAAVRAKGGSFGSIKVGGEYISTDFFGPFEMPLVTFLNTRRTGNILKGVAGGVASKAIDAPVLKDILGSSEAIKEMATSKDDIISAIGENVANASITRLTPNALNTIAKVIDGKERKTNTVVEKLMARVPLLRQQLPERISVATGDSQEIQRLNMLLLGSRGKHEETAPLATEISRLASAGVAVNIVDPTRSGVLSKLSDEEKSRIQDMFATEFAKKASKEIARASYRRKSDEDKKDALDDVRKSVVDDIKRKYRNQIKVLKKTKK